MSELHLRTTLTPRGPAAAIILTDEQVASLGAGKASPVVVTIGERSVRLRLARMGGENLIGFSKASRVEAGIEPGQELDVTIAVDTAERSVDIPPALADALAVDAAAKATFDALSYTRRKEIARSIADAKQEVTRARRLEKALSELR